MSRLIKANRHEMSIIARFTGDGMTYLEDYDYYAADYDDFVTELPLWKRVRIRINLFIYDYLYWKFADLLWQLFKYDLFEGRFVNNLEPDPQCDAEYAAGQYEEYNNIDDFLASFEDDK